MNIIQHSTQFYTRATPRRAPLGLVLHNTVSRTLATPTANGSWHLEIDRDGACHQYVYASGQGHDYAYHVRIADEWRPSWVVRRDSRVSDVNSCTVGIELVSYAGATSPPPESGYVPYTDLQYTTLRDLLELLTGWYGPLPIVTHGSLQLDRSDPVAFDPGRAALFWRGDGYRYEPEHAGMAILNDAELLEAAQKVWLDVPANPDAGFYKAWVAELRAGRYRGKPLAGEEGTSFGAIQRFDGGMASYKPGAPVSWDG